MSTQKQIAKGKKLLNSLNELESSLDDLLSQDLLDTAVPLSTLQQAKLYALLPYVLNDLIFVFLKTKGIDPRDHPVVAELDRVKHYFDKIKNAEDPAQRRFAVDVAAAGRFIKHAISQHIKAPVPLVNIPEEPPVHVPTRLTTKMMEREEYLKQVRDAGDETDEDQVVEMYDDIPPATSSSVEENLKPMDVDMGEQHLETVPILPKENLSSGKRRYNIDPFTGQAEYNSEEATNKRVKDIISSAGSRTQSPATSNPTSSNDEGNALPAKRRRKKQKKRPSGAGGQAAASQ